MKRELTILTVGIITFTATLIWISREAARRRAPGRSTVAGIFVNESIRITLETFRIHVGRYPTNAEGTAALSSAPPGTEGRWRGPYIKTESGRMPLDPWGSEYQYCCPGAHNPAQYDFWSLGPDKMQSADDIGNWTQ